METNFKRRLATQKREDKEYRTFGEEKSGDAWKFASGDYSQGIFPQEFGTPHLTGLEKRTPRRLEQVENLIGIEQSLGKMMEQLINESEKRPLIFFDFGGGIGLSWCRLALQFQDSIKKGDVKFIVSNIEQGFSPVKAAELRLPESEQKIVAQAVDAGLVTYIEAELLGNDTKEANSLRQYKLGPDSSTPLIANTDLIHARMSLIHTEIPEFHYLRLLELLSDCGIFIDSSLSKNSPAPPNPENKTMQRHKNQLMAAAQQYVMENLDLTQVSAVEAGPRKDQKIAANVLKKNSTEAPDVWA
ncbi:MAG: hypothetical protein U9O78_04150 [Patescibacteria group bacterium]|nr:hypothetical protein [Patescibacteria group bacterium]